MREMELYENLFLNERKNNHHRNEYDTSNSNTRTHSYRSRRYHNDGTEFKNSSPGITTALDIDKSYFVVRWSSSVEVIDEEIRNLSHDIVRRRAPTPVKTNNNWGFGYWHLRDLTFYHITISQLKITRYSVIVVTYEEIFWKDLADEQGKSWQKRNLAKMG